MATYNETASGGAKAGGKAYVIEQRASTIDPPCGCCRNKLCQDTAEATLGFPLPETWTVTIESANTTCCAFNTEFTFHYTGSIIQEGNQNQPGIIGGCFLNYAGFNPCNGPNGFSPMSFVLQGLGPPSFPVGAFAATLTIGTGFQNVSYQSLHFEDGTMVLDHLIGTSSSCSSNFGGSWNDNIPVASHTAFPVFTYQTLRHPCTPSTDSPNGAFVCGYQGGATTTDNFTYDTTTGDFAGTISAAAGNPAGSFTGTFNFTTGVIVITTAGTSFTSSQGIGITIKYTTPSDYPASLTMTPGDPLDCPACDDPQDEESDHTQDRTCRYFELIITKDIAVAGGPTIKVGHYLLQQGVGYLDVAGSGYTSVGCGSCQWNYNHQSGQVGFMMTPGTLSYGINPTVTQMKASSPTHGSSAESAFECLWTSYMDWTIDTDNGFPSCNCWTPIDDGIWIVPDLSGGVSPITVWKPRTGGGAIVGGSAVVS